MKISDFEALIRNLPVTVLLPHQQDSYCFKICEIQAGFPSFLELHFSSDGPSQNSRRLSEIMDYPAHHLVARDATTLELMAYIERKEHVPAWIYINIDELLDGEQKSGAGIPS